MLTFDEIADEYDGWKNANPDSDWSLSDFAQETDKSQGVSIRTAAYGSNYVKRAGRAVDQLFKPVSEPLRQAGSFVDDYLKKHAYIPETSNPVADSLSSLPRVAAETIPLAMSTGGLGALGRGAIWGARLLGLGSEAAVSYKDTDNPLAATIAAASLPLGLGGAKLGGQLTAKALAPMAAKPARDALAMFLGENLGASVAGELGRQASITALGEGDRNPFTIENLIENVVGTLPEALTSAGPDLVRGKGSQQVNTLRAQPVLRSLNELRQRTLAESFAESEATKQDLQARFTEDRQQDLYNRIEETYGADVANTTLLRELNTQATVDRAKSFVQKPLASLDDLFADKDVRALLKSDSEPSALPKELADQISAKFAEAIKGDDATTPSGNREESLSRFSRLDLPTTLENLSIFIRDVNTSIKRDWYEQFPTTNSEDALAIKLADERRRLYGIEGIKETPERPKIEPTAFNPLAFFRLQSEGRIPQITPEWLKSIFQERWETSLNHTDQEAYTSMVQTVKNLMISLAEQAKLQKSLESQRQQELLSSGRRKTDSELDEIYVLDLKKLPEELQQKVIKQWPDLLKESQQLQHGNRSVSRWRHHRSIVHQAIENYNPKTNLTAITLRERSLDNQFKTRTVVMPLEEAVLFKPQKRDSFSGAQAPTISLELFKQEASKVAKQQIFSTETADLAETALKLQTGEAHKIKNRQVVSDLTTDVADLDTNLSGLPEQSNSDSESNLQQASDEQRVAQELQHMQSDAGWEAYKTLFSDETGAIRGEERRKALFPAAVKALYGDSTDVLEFGQRFKGKKAVTMAEATNAVTTYWRYNSKNNIPALIEKVRERLKLTPEVTRNLLIYDPTTQQIKLRDVPKLVQFPLDQGIVKFYTQHFRALGYSPELVEQYVASALKMVHMAWQAPANTTFGPVAISIRNKTIVPQVADLLRVFGIYTIEKDPRGQTSLAPAHLGAALFHKASTGLEQGLSNFITLTTLAHESMHGNESLAQLADSPNADVRAKQQNFRNTLQLLESMSPQERFELLRNVAQVIVPAHFHKPDTSLYGFLQYGAGSPLETLTIFSQMYLAGLATNGRKLDVSENLAQSLRWTFPELNKFLRSQFRDISNFTSGLVTLLKDSNLRDQLKLPQVLGDVNRLVSVTEQLDGLVKQFLRPDYEQLRAQQTVAQIVKYLEDHPLSDFTNPQTSPQSSLGSNVPVVREARRVVFDGFGPLLTGDAHNSVKQATDLNFWTRNFMPFIQVASRLRNPTASQIAHTLLSTQPAIKRVLHQALHPLTMRDQKNQLIVNPEKALAQIVKPENTHLHKIFNDIGREMQELGDSGLLSKPIMLSDSKTYSTIFDQLLNQSPELRQVTLKHFENLSPAERGLVQEALNNALEVYTNHGDILIKAQVDHGVARVARLLQSFGETSGAKALQRGQQIFNGILLQQPNQLNEGLAGLSPKSAETLTEFVTNMAQNVKTLEEHFSEKPYYMSEARPGTHLVRIKLANGNRRVEGADSRKHAEQIAAQFEKTAQDITIIDKALDYDDLSANMPDRFAEAFKQLEDQAVDKLLQKLSQQLPPEIVAIVRENFAPSAEIYKSLTTKGVNTLLQERKLVGGRENLDYIRNMQAQSQQLAGITVRRGVQDIINVLLNDASLKDEATFKAMVKRQVDYTMKPSNPLVQQTRTMMSSYFLAANFSSMAAESVQNLVTLVPHLIASGDSVSQAYSRLGRNIGKFLELNDSTKRKVLLSKNDPTAKAYQDYLDTNVEGANVYDDLELSQDLSSVLKGRNRYGHVTDYNLAQMSMNGLYNVSKLFMKTYGKVSAWNSKIGFLSGLEQAHEKGLTGSAAVDYAMDMVHLGSFGGGKANNPGYVARWSRATPAVGLVHTLQQYGMGLTSMMGNLLSDSILSNKHLNPVQRKQARKAAGTLFMTQLALSGTLGLPFAAAGLTALSKLFGVNLQALLTEGLAQFTSDDDETGQLISDVALNGLASRLGVDVSGRMGLSNLLGTSSYYGFNFKDMFGPAPSIFENFFQAGQQALAGEPLRAATSLAPQAFKNVLTMLQSQQDYGDFRLTDAGSNLIYEPSNMESLTYALGFQPTRLRQYRAARNLQNDVIATSNAQQNRAADAAAKGLLHNDTQPLNKYLEEQVQAGRNPRLALYSVIDRAIDMSNPKDLLATSKAQSNLIRAMVSPLNRRSEEQRLLMRDNVLRHMNYPMGTKAVSSKELQRARKLDDYISQGLTRTEALQKLANFENLLEPVSMWGGEEDLF